MEDTTLRASAAQRLFIQPHPACTGGAEIYPPRVPPGRMKPSTFLSLYDKLEKLVQRLVERIL